MLRTGPEISQRIFQSQAPLIQICVELSKSHVQCIESLHQHHRHRNIAGQQLSIQVVGVFKFPSNSGRQIVPEALFLLVLKI